VTSFLRNQSSRLGVFLLACVCGLVASRPGPRPHPGTLLRADRARVSGCGLAQRPQRGQYTIDVGGRPRSYYLLPSSKSGPVPLVLSFHGYGGSGQRNMNDLSPEAASHGAAVHVFPDGVAQPWRQNARGWDARWNESADIAFVLALIEEAKAKHCIDEQRIYAVGFSWGGWMAMRVACALGEEIRGAVSVAGGGPHGLCGGPVKVLVAHGAADQTADLAQGRFSRDRWLDLNGCQHATASPASLAGCVTYGGCSKPVWWCEHQGGHEVPAFLVPGYFDFLNSPD
jgi:poly(3-hydroxybutyrate) depolymerase